MEIADYINTFFRYLVINIIASYMYTKVSNFKDIKNNHKIILVIICILLSICYTFISNTAKPSSILLISCISIGIFFSYITKYELDYSIVIVLISLAITIIIYMLSILISLMLFMRFTQIDGRNIIILLTATIIEMIIIHYLFKIKRFKNGFSFLKKKDRNYELIIFLYGSVFFIFYNLKPYNSEAKNQLLYMYGFIILISSFLWIQRKITSYYKGMLKEDAIDNLKKELGEKKLENENIQEELNKIAKINHKYSNRIASLELYINKLSKDITDEKDREKVLEASKLIKDLEKEYSSELLENLNSINKTGLKSIDNLLDYFNTECAKKNISFNVIVETNIRGKVEESIPINLFETLLSDTIKNAIIAIGYSSEKDHKILVQFDYNEFLEIRVYDTGIEFEKGTLYKLGREQITTHKSDGGSGIGFVTTFETLNKTKGSLIIEEYENNESGYSKCIIFKFNNKGQYVIKSYRAKQLRESNKSEKIIIQSIKSKKSKDKAHETIKK